MRIASPTVLVATRILSLAFASEGQTIIGEFLCLPLFSYNNIMMTDSRDSSPIVGPRRCRLLPKSASSNGFPVTGPQRPLLSFSSLVPPVEPSGSLPVRGIAPAFLPPAGCAPGLFCVLCLRCAQYAACDPSVACRFDKSASKKCARCREQKSPCLPVCETGFSSIIR